MAEEWKPITREWWEKAIRDAGRTGLVGAVPIAMVAIFVSSVRVIGEVVPEILAGRESGGQAFGVFGIVLLIAWVTRRLMNTRERADLEVVAR